ncbi:acyl-CoA dehydrogenase family protein [Novosphingobium sp. MMS21-SN21R]|uniref:acyl-CoA dehydrogenase family protein n=1 Tax=Novosphingobium sp. MMS21-SN21R TaxID=2969298 RepID=UPI0028866765|nr:acyl-CoA dehydrogenase family protein [Novosphingobium sp. MMS21-SN21R]MDT0509885.1 acyl-CoA dehydrogenase family protein [Novosphingobium sp. MMS21-SN21R]
MNFDYTDDQKSLKEEARRFLAAASPLTVARGVLEAPDAGYDTGLWARIAEQGWCGATIPEAYGGLGLGYVELCALAEELGRAVAPVPFASSIYFFAEGVLLAGNEEQKSTLLPLVSAGELIGTLAVSEGPGALTGARIAAKVTAGKLSGTKLPVADGMAAGLAIVLAQSESGLGLFLADLSDASVTRAPVSTIDPTRGSARIVFDATPVTPLGEAGKGFETLARIQDRGAILLAFEQLGGADRCLEMARDYALERYAFGRPIGSYQAIKHKLADVFVKNEVARANAYYGAWALSTDADELPVAAAAARVAGCAAYWLAAKEMIQTHGGIGVTWEADCHFFYRRARHLGLVIGAPRDWKRRLADGLEARVNAENAA